MNGYIAGTLVRVATYSGGTVSPSGGFRDANGALADPSTVTLEYREGPGNPLVTVTYPPAGVIVRDGAGLYHADLDSSVAVVSGVWTYEWQGAGMVQAVSPLGQFNVSIQVP